MGKLNQGLIWSLAIGLLLSSTGCLKKEQPLWPHAWSRQLPPLPGPIIQPTVYLQLKGTPSIAHRLVLSLNHQLEAGGFQVVSHPELAAYWLILSIEQTPLAWQVEVARYTRTTQQFQFKPKGPSRRHSPEPSDSKRSTWVAQHKSEWILSEGHLTLWPQKKAHREDGGCDSLARLIRTTLPLTAYREPKTP